MKDIEMTIYAQLDEAELVVTEYPLTIYQIRALYPEVSWPLEPDAAALDVYHLVIVVETPPPPPKKKYIIVEVDPAKIDDVWTQQWVYVRK
jgi:hypothetical protein